jgi:dolichol kinase|tara:strand:- start:46 stop:636 length:591 start_codon:yes stop_codon:yes gene_type:complete
MGRKIATKRKFLSLFIVLFALLYYFTNKTIFVFTMSSMLALFLFFDLLNYFSKGKNKLAKHFFRLYPKKREELKSILTDATLFFISTLLMSLFFQKEVVIFSLILLTFVDMSEQIFGKLLPFKKLPWNPQKSFLGTFMGFLIGTIVSYLVITTILENIPLIVILPASIVAAIAGTSKKFDNILIPWCVSIILIILL